MDQSISDKPLIFLLLAPLAFLWLGLAQRFGAVLYILEAFLNFHRSILA